MLFVFTRLPKSHGSPRVCTEGPCPAVGSDWEIKLPQLMSGHGDRGRTSRTPGQEVLEKKGFDVTRDIGDGLHLEGTGGRDG